MVASLNTTPPTALHESHLPSLERPDLFNPFLLEFLAALTGAPDSAEKL